MEIKDNLSSKVIENIIKLSKDPHDYKIQLEKLNTTSLRAYFYYLVSYRSRRDEFTPSTVLLSFDDLVQLLTITSERDSVNCIIYDIFQITCILLQDSLVFTNYITNIKELNNLSLKILSFLTETFRIDITPIRDLLMDNLFAGEQIDRNLIIDCLNANFEALDKCALLENIVKSEENIFMLNDFTDRLIEDRTLLSTPKFWIYLAQCLAHDDNKYAVSILKLIIKYFHSNQMDFECGTYFTWAASLNESFTTDWNNFLLVLDSLLEKQNHLIMPTLNLLKPLKYIDDVWSFALLDKILNHHNNTVTNFGITYILENYDINTIQYHPKLLNDLLGALNVNYLYAYDYSKQLASFFRKSPTAIFSNITNSNLNAISLYNFLNLFHSQLIDSKFNDRDLLANLIKTVANCPNLTIRSACQIMLIKILNHAWPHFKLTELLILIENIVHVIDNKSNVLLYFDSDVLALHDYAEIVACNAISVDTKINIIFYLLNVNVINVNILTDIVHTRNNFIDGDEFILNLILKLKQQGINVKVDLDRFYENPKSFEILFNIQFNLMSIRHLDLCDDLTTIKLVSDHITYADHSDLYSKHLNFLNGLNLKTCDIKQFCGLQNNLLRFSHDHIQAIISNSLELLEIADKSNLSYIFDTIELVAGISDLVNDQKFNLFLCIDRGYREIVALRKNEYYWILIKKLIKIILINDRAIQDPIWREHVTEKYLDILMKEAQHTNGIGYILYKRLLTLNYLTLIGWANFESYLINGLIFGETLMKREQVLEGKIMKSIWSENQNLNIKSHFTYETNPKIRALCIAFLYKIRGLNCNEFLAGVTAALVVKSLKLGKLKPRYYAYSQHHRVKLRIIQSLAILFGLNKLDFVHSDFILTTLDLENNQTNITIILELVAVELFSPKDLLNYICSLKKISPSKITSFLIITYLKCIKEFNLSLCENTIKLFLHWTMAQHFQTRLYAQITILKLIEHFNLTTHEKYTLIYTNIQECLKYGNYDINSKKLLNDFRYNSDVSLNFSNLLSLETILFNIPRITEMPEEELIPINLIKNAGLLLDYEFNDPENYKYDSSLDNIDVMTNNCGATKLIVENEIEIEQMVDGNFQKKIIIPLKQTIPCTIDLFDFDENTDNSNGLIVVASLVTRQPNLGGLARSCEIFGVRKYVIDSLKHVENREFQALSVTAEKWLRMEEVKTHHLKQYLQMMKRKGYTVIGAEQTSNSISIEKIDFPKKSIILLGNEKEGVPANLISLFDITAEIPQFGIVRSLNVHVTGAIFMWEYAKQHLINL